MKRLQYPAGRPIAEDPASTLIADTRPEMLANGLGTWRSIYRCPQLKGEHTILVREGRASAPCRDYLLTEEEARRSEFIP